MEKAILVTVDLKRGQGWPAVNRAAELRELARSSGASVEGEIVCRRDRPTPDLFIGKGKLEELLLLAKDKKAIHRELDRAERMVSLGGYIPGFDHAIPPNVPWNNYKYAITELKRIIGV